VIVQGDLTEHPVLGSFSLYDLIMHAGRRLNQAGYALDIVQLDSERRARIRRSSRGLQWIWDAGLFVGWQKGEVEPILDRIPNEKPYIVVDCDLGQTRYSYAYKDFTQASRHAAEHFLRNGHRRISFVSGDGDSVRRSKKLAGFQDALVANGFPLRHFSIRNLDLCDSIAAGYRTASERILESNPPTAIFCTDNVCAIGVLWGLEKVGCQVPDEIEVIGYGDEPFAIQAPKPLSFIRIPSMDIAAYCMDRILEWTETQTPFQPVQKRFVEELVFRETTRPDRPTEPGSRPDAGTGSRVQPR
jgi:DNA-binding LacI/PurR family transcriptional regulator